MEVFCFKKKGVYMKKLNFVLTLVAVANFAYGSNLNAQGSEPAVVDSPIKSQRKLDLPIEIQEKLNSEEFNPLGAFHNTYALKKGCELTVHIEGAHSKGDFEILTKEDFANKDIERAISITVWAQHGAAVSSQIENNNEVIADNIIYIKYKESTDKPEKTNMYYYVSKYRRIRRLSKAQMEKDKFLQYDFTYCELINAVEKLVYKDELKLAGDTISVIKRVVKELPDGIFRLQVGFSPKPRPPY
jgi:hypothetical protein